LGIHESQSRLWENFVGRSLPFWKAHYRRLLTAFPEQLSGYSAEDFYKAINVVRPSLIRVEADEVTYTLHVILRFELEKALLTGDLKVADIPAAWNEKMQQYLGLLPPDDTRGCLQDIHWADGLIGYFPTYSLGNLVAAMLWESVSADIPNLTQSIQGGNNGPLLNWLREKVHRHASLYTPKELLSRSLGKALDYRPFMTYLESKFRPLYGLT
jgi:carboxypeptidase Taq